MEVTARQRQALAKARKAKAMKRQATDEAKEAARVGQADMFPAPSSVYASDDEQADVHMSESPNPRSYYRKRPRVKKRVRRDHYDSDDDDYEEQDDYESERRERPKAHGGGGFFSSSAAKDLLITGVKLAAGVGTTYLLKRITDSSGPTGSYHAPNQSPVYQFH